MSLCSSRQSWKAAVHACLLLVTLPFTPAHESRLCILRQTQSHWVCMWLDRRIIRSSYVLVIAWSWAFWASWSICLVCSISNLQASMSSLDKTVVLDPAAFRSFFNIPASLSTALARFLHCTLSPFLQMGCRIVTTWAGYSSVFPQEEMDMLKTVPLGCLIVRVSCTSLVVTRSVCGTYRTDGWLLSFPFLHSESFSPLGVLRVVLILACCQSVVLSTRFLNKDLSGTCRNPPTCMVAWKKISQRAKILGPQKHLLVPTPHVRGMVQAWVGQKLVKSNIWQVFFIIWWPTSPATFR